MDVLKDPGKFPCAVCRNGCLANCILCSQCELWVHHNCSCIKGRLYDDRGYVCCRCRGEARQNEGWPMTTVCSDSTPLEVVPCFSYLGVILSADGCGDLAIDVRCQTAWGKFRRLLPLLTSKHLSLKTRGKLYSACVGSAILYGSETWAMKASSLVQLERN